MNSKLLAGAVIALMAGTGLVASPVQADAQFLMILDTPEGIVERTVSQGELDVILQCRADAPNVPSCTNGPLVRISGASHGIVLPIPSGFTGPNGDVPVHQVRVTSILSGGGQERIFRCLIWERAAPGPANQPIAFQCGVPASTGSFPPIGAEMTQTAIGFSTLSHGPSARPEAAQDITPEETWKGTDGAVLIPGLGRFIATMNN